MIDKELLRSVIEDKLSQTDCFLVSLSVSSTTSIVVAIDAVTSVSLEFCIELTQYIEQKFDRNTEDYSLEVGSYSISEPFVDSRQYVKNIGRTIEILTLEHKKIRGTLLKADSAGFTVETEAKEQLEGQKRKTIVTRQISLAYNDVKSTKLYF